MKHDDQFMDEEQAGDAVARYLEEDPGLMEGIAPPRDLWPAIESRISARVLALDPNAGREAGIARNARRARWIPTVIAACALVAASAGVTYVLTTRGSTRSEAPSSVVAATTDSARSPGPGPGQQAILPPHDREVATSSNTNDEEAPRRKSAATGGRRAVPQLASHSSGGGDETRRTYDTEIATLNNALDARRGQLNPATVAVIEQNLRVIDEAIRQSKAALARDPNSRLLNDQLDRTLAKKTGLLRAAALLPAA